MANAQQPAALPVTMMAGQGGIPDGSLFGLPGVTIYSEQKENNSPVATTLATGSQATALFPSNFKQTDIVYAWRMLVSINQTYTAGGGTFTLSPYFPYNFLAVLALNLQNQFDTISYLNGIDAAIFQMIRPQKQESWIANAIDQNSFSNAYSSQGNIITSSSYTTASTTVTFDIDLLPGFQFDLYYDLEENGMLLNTKAQGIRTFVGPQMMAGTNRIVQPRVIFNQGLSTTAADISPVTVTGGTPTFSGSATLNFRRKVSYQPQSSKDAPLLWNWQYSRQTVRGSLSGLSQVTIPLPLVGQILAFYVRMWDPSSGTVGAPIPLANITECDVQIGSGLFRYQDTPEDMQSRFLRQHGLILPAGVLCWDMATDDFGRLTNAYAINTLTTSGCQVVITFTGTQSSTAYYVLGYEALRYVALQ